MIQWYLVREKKHSVRNTYTFLQVWTSTETLTEFLCLRLHYVLHLLATELSNPRSKLNIDAVPKATLKLFVSDMDGEKIEKLAALDLMIPQDRWHSMWASAFLQTTSPPDDIIKYLAEQLNANPTDVLKRLRGSEQQFHLSQDEAQETTEVWFVVFFIVSISLLFIHTNKQQWLVLRQSSGEQ